MRLKKARLVEITSVSQFKLRFIFIYGIIGFISTLILFIYQFAHFNTTSHLFLLALLIANPVLALTVYASWKEKKAVASGLGLVTVFMGCFGAVSLDFSSFITLLMVFVLSTLFITQTKWEISTAYFIMGSAILVKLLIESKWIVLSFLPVSNLSIDSIFYISILSVSIITYAGFINYLLNKGIHANEKLDKTSKDLIETAAVKDRLLALISHDIRGSVGNVSTILESIHQKELEADENTIKLLLDTTNSTFDLLNNLLTWSKYHINELKINPEEFALCELVEETKDLFSSSTHVKNLKINNQCNKTNRVIADRSMIFAALRNLISNAIKFSHENGEINVFVTNSEDSIQVSIQDNGVGIDQEVASKLFTNQHEIQSTNGTQKEKGAGIGLILAKEFVEANQGEIGVSSEVGKGSVFWFKLPQSSIQAKQ